MARTFPLTTFGSYTPVDMLVLKRRIMLSHVLPLAKVGWFVMFLKNSKGYGLKDEDRSLAISNSTKSDDTIDVPLKYLAPPGSVL